MPVCGYWYSLHWGASASGRYVGRKRGFRTGGTPMLPKLYRYPSVENRLHTGVNGGYSRRCGGVRRPETARLRERIGCGCADV